MSFLVVKCGIKFIHNYGDYILHVYLIYIVSAIFRFFVLG